MTPTVLRTLIVLYLVSVGGYVASLWSPESWMPVEASQYVAWYEKQLTGSVPSAMSLIAFSGLILCVVAAIGLLRLSSNARYLFATGVVLAAVSEAGIGIPVLKTGLQALLDSLASLSAGAIMALCFASSHSLFSRDT